MGVSLPVAPLQEVPFLTDGGRMGARARGHDWAAHPFGAPSRWSPTLRAAIAMVLGNEYPQLICWGPELRMIYNDAFLPILAGKPDALGRSVFDVFAEIQEALRPMMAGVIGSGKAVYAEDQMFPLVRHGSTEDCYFTFCYSPMRENDGSIGGVLVTCSETTSRVLAERRMSLLREVATRSASLDETAAWRGAAEAFATDPADLPAFELWSSSEAAPVARSSADLPVTTGTTRAALLRSALSGARAEAAASGASGAYRAVLAFPIGQARGVPLGALLVAVGARVVLDEGHRTFVGLAAEQIATSIQNARAREADRRRAEELESLDRAKTAFFSNVSHEFRTPLTLQLGPVEQLLARDDLSAHAREQLETVQRNSRRLLKLVNTLLDFSRIESGGHQARFAPCDLGELTAEIASAFASAMSSAGLEYVVDAERAPGFYVDRDLFEKALLNLISNAYKFTSEGRVVVRVRAGPDEACIEVQDTGVGIDAAELPHVFERFHRGASAPARSQVGTGIGLALVQEIARFHGGRIEVVSAPREGSTFRWIIPAGSAHLLPAQIVSEPASGSRVTTGADETVASFLAETRPSAGPDVARPGPPDEARRVLVVDDNADMRRHLGGILAPRWRVLEARDGEEALELLARERVDLVLSDVMMPRRDGFSLLRALRADPNLRHLPFLVLSARAGPEASAEGLAVGADDYIVKPFSAAELTARVAVNMELAQMRREEAARVASILESISDSFFAVDRTWRLTFLNRRCHESFEELLGTRRESFVGERLWDLFSSEEADFFRARYEEAMASGRTVHVEGHYAEHWFEVTAYPTAEGLSVFNRDVTARKRDEMRLSALAHLSAEAGLARTLDETYDAAFRAIAASMGSARASILLFDDDGVMRFKAARGISADYRARVEGHTPWTPATPDPAPIIVDDVEADASLAAYGDLFARERIRSLVFFPLRHEGRVIGKFMAYAETPSAFGPDQVSAGVAISGVIAMAISRRRAEEDAARARIALSRTDKLSSLGMLVSGVAHEIRTPLTIIENNTHILELRLRNLVQLPAAHEKLRAPVEEMRAAIERANALVGQLKRYTRLESAVAVKLDVNKACEEAMRLVQATRNPRDKVRAELLATTAIRADPSQIQQVVINLLANALDATGGDAARVCLLTRNEGDRVTLEVRDEGPGMSVATRARLFEPLFTTKADGTGLGLSIVKRIVHEHGATVVCESEPGRGSRFIVTFPATPRGAAEGDHVRSDKV